VVRLVRYEFWPAEVFYFPFLFYYIYLSIKVWDLGFMFRLNPFMAIGGAIGTGKMANLQRLSREYLPITLLVGDNASKADLLGRVRASGLWYPIMLKPDVGERGRGVQRVDSDEELYEAYKRLTGAVVIQEYVDTRNELGVLCYREPTTGRIRILSVVSKVFLSVTGNGKDDLRTLMGRNLRSRMRYQELLARLGPGAMRVPAMGETVYLEPVGNHCRGTEFCNSNELINKGLEMVFDRICASIPKFDYGRFDIKYATLENLYKGKGIKILELNGVNSEAGHIYGRGYGIHRAYRDVKRQFDTMFAIYRAKYMAQDQGPSLREVLRAIVAHRRLANAE
jgi:hypothetical protein